MRVCEEISIYFSGRTRTFFETARDESVANSMKVLTINYLPDFLRTSYVERYR